MGDDRFKSWANRATRGGGMHERIEERRAAEATQPAPKLIIPGRNPPQVRQVPITRSPGHRPSPVTATQLQVISRPAPRARAIEETQGGTETCVIMTPSVDGKDGYAELLDSVPELMTEDMSGGADAMAMSGAPPGVALNKWTGRARYYNGVCDESSGGQIDAHVRGRFRENRAALHSSKATRVHPGQNYLPAEG